MRETWLKMNWRLHLPIIVAKAAILAATLLFFAQEIGGWLTFVIGGTMVSLYAALVWCLIRYSSVLCYDNGKLCVYRGRMAIARVPIDVVEGFLLGQGPSYLPGKNASKLDVATVVVKLADQAEEWEHQEMDSRFGSWCGHYITIRGTVCEPISLELVNRLNARLYEVTQELKHQQAAV